MNSANLQSSLASYNTSDPYQDSQMLINNLKQEQSPDKSHGDSQEDYDVNDDDEDNDRFLEELEQENLMLEKELESLMQLKSSQQKEIQKIPSEPASADHSPTSDKGSRNLTKIDERIEEERESYYYSNSDDEHPIPKTRSKNKTPLPAEPKNLKESEYSLALSASNVDFGTSEPRGFKFRQDYDEGIDKERDNFQSSPLRASHLSKSIQDETASFAAWKEKKKTSEKKPQAKDKENISHNDNDTSTTEISSKRKSATGSTGRKSRSNNSPPAYEKMDKVSSLEARLAGANKTIKALEADLRIKNEKISDLGKEIEKKSKLIESQQSNSASGSRLKKSDEVKESLTTLMRKKEKDMEKKLKEQEILLTENKKYMTRLQELNSKLLSKVKELEDENLFLKTNEEVTAKVKAYEEENKKLKEKIRGIEKENGQLIQRCDDQENRIRNMVDNYENFESKSERFIQKNRDMTDTLLSLINLNNDWSNALNGIEDNASSN